MDNSEITEEHINTRNKVWVEEITRKDKDFFIKQSNGQKPKLLWLSCSDSRVSPAYIIKAEPGEIFEYRSVANIISANDINLIAILKYAVEFLNIKKIIICGHYNCGGLLTIVNNEYIPIVSEHLSPAKTVFEDNKSIIEKAISIAHKCNLLSELNVEKQISNLKEISIIKNALDNLDDLCICGYIYNTNNGLLKKLCEISKEKNLKDK
ncbi:MAG: carbonic anhydrase [Solitalea-like symbiont of Acarus siro]